MSMTNILKATTGCDWIEEHTFSGQRKWRFDFACPSLRIAIEQEGGVHTGGRHIRPTGFLKDVEKYNAAAIAGWCVLRFTVQQMNTGHFARELDAAVSLRREKRWSETGRIEPTELQSEYQNAPPTVG